MSLRIIISFFSVALLFSSTCIGQSAGEKTFEFLNMVTSARIASLGGNAISLKDNDLELAYQNPSLLNKEMDNHFVLNYSDYFADINLGSFYYAKTYDKLGSFAAGIQYMHYGTFKETDEIGNVLRDFVAEDIVVSIGWGIPITPKFSLPNGQKVVIDSLFHIGSNLKLIYSSYHFDYQAIGVAMDLSSTYWNPKNNLTIALVLKNIGLQLKSYTKENKENIPLDLQLGISKKLKHAPFRLMLNLQHLENWDLTYTSNSENTTVLNDAVQDTTLLDKIGKNILGFGDKFMRHATIGSEIIITNNFNIRLGYNYRRRKELGVSTKKGLNGFSFGVGIKVSKLHLSYGRAAYHLAGAPNYITLRTNFSEFSKKASDLSNRIQKVREPTF